MVRRQTSQGVALAGVPRVNLLPRAEVDRRERASAIRRWGWGVVGALAIVIVASAAAYGANWVAGQGLAAAQSRTTSLTGTLAGLRDVSAAVKARTDLEMFRTQAMGTDIDYLKTVGALAAAIPDGTSITGFDLTPGGAPVAGQKPGAAAGLVGTLTLTSSTPLEAAPVIRAIRDVPGVMTADGQEIVSADKTGSGGPYDLTVTIQFDQTVYTGNYGKDSE